MIKARIRWCSCRVENILTLVKSVVLFPPPFYSYRTYKIISSYELASPIMGTIFLVNIYSILHILTIVFPDTCTVEYQPIFHGVT